jgi:hypothetical protein
VAVDVRVTPVTALLNVDYFDYQDTLVWGAGDSSPRIIEILLNDDSASELTKTFRAVLFNPDGANLGANSIATVTIIDTDTGSGNDTVRFTPNEYVVTETPGGSTLNLSVTRSGTGVGAVSVDYNSNFPFPGATEPVANVDYTAVSGTLNWADGDLATKTISLPILDDAADEARETMAVQLLNISGAVLGPQYAGVVRIDDND